MFKPIYKLIKKIVLSFIVLYGYNMITTQFNLTIPINIFTISIMTFFGTSGFIGLILFFLLNFR